MKRIALITLLILLSCISHLSAQTLLLEENFNHSTGILTTVNINWSESPTGSSDIQAVTGSLSFTNYPASGVGQKIVLDGGAASRSGVISVFTSQSGNGTTVYSSFLLKVTSTLEMDSSDGGGDRFSNFKVAGSSSFRACVFVRQGTTASQFQIGLGKLNTSTPVWHSSELSVNTVHLIVTAYLFQSGNDAARMWINPDLGGTEPLYDLEQTTGSDATSLGEVQFRQEPLSGDMEVDGLRVATSWSQAPLPVEISSFKGYYSHDKINLSWRTETELNNYGFEVERRDGRWEMDDGRWEKIGFVNGNGNSNSPREYTFVENISVPGKYLFRLKQIDFDGNFKYSEITGINVPAPSGFMLNQNYPNPFNPTTTISFNLPKQQHVTLEVFNILGQKIVTLLNEIKPAGTHTVNFDASSAGGGLNSGFYIYKLAAENFTQIKKMTLIK